MIPGRENAKYMISADLRGPPPVPVEPPRLRDPNVFRSPILGASAALQLLDPVGFRTPGAGGRDRVAAPLGTRRDAFGFQTLRRGFAELGQPQTPSEPNLLESMA